VPVIDPFWPKAAAEKINRKMEIKNSLIDAEPEG
jgi:hypothetical protein